MADVRALLKAKRQEVRITHPFATYTSAGQLRCVACGTAVKHASAWEGHIGSKAHRSNAARVRQEQARAQAQAEAEERERESLKRKAAEMEVDNEGDDDDDNGAELDDDAVVTKKPRVGGAPTRSGALPADFFSDPSMAPLPRDDEDEEADEDQDASTVPTTSAAGSKDALDDEWARFQQSVIEAPDYQETYARATVAAEAVLSTEVPQGFPGSNTEGGETAGAEGAAAGEGALDEEGLRRKKEQEERELIMDRLVEEEQAQEEADARVTALKTKLEALRARREAARAAKKGAK